MKSQGRRSLFNSKNLKQTIDSDNLNLLSRKKAIWVEKIPDLNFKWTL